MSLLAEIEKAIEQLRIQRDALLQAIQDFGWVDERRLERIPEQVVVQDFNLPPLLHEVTLPEKSPLPPNCCYDYQHWYSAARAVISRNQAERLSEFDQIYAQIYALLSKFYVCKEEEFHLIDLINFQFSLVEAVMSHLQFSLYDIELTAYSVLMDDELEAALYLCSKGFLRPAGTLAGVILERHLKNLLRKHTPPIKYGKRANIGQLNDRCKNTAYDLVTWRKVQHLADLRHLCTHDKERDPTREEVEELIAGVSAILKTYSVA